MAKFSFTVVVKNQKDFLAKYSVFEREQKQLKGSWNSPRKLETKTFLIDYGCDPVTGIRETAYFDFCKDLESKGELRIEL